MNFGRVISKLVSGQYKKNKREDSFISSNFRGDKEPNFPFHCNCVS
jgi:hypothetical protein